MDKEGSYYYLRWRDLNPLPTISSSVRLERFPEVWPPTQDQSDLLEDYTIRDLYKPVANSHSVVFIVGVCYCIRYIFDNERRPKTFWILPSCVGMYPKSAWIIYWEIVIEAFSRSDGTLMVSSIRNEAGWNLTTFG